MSTIHINPNDTIIVCGESIEKIAKVGPIYVNEAATNVADQYIVTIICLTILGIVFICVCGFIHLKNNISKNLQKYEENKRKNEVEDKYFKLREELLSKKLERMKPLYRSDNDKYLDELVKEIDNCDKKLK